jgi:hypothetical protein
MSVELEGDRIRLIGRCKVEDAEALLSHLQEDSERTVDVSETTGLHTAAIQILLAAQPTLSGEPADLSLRRWLIPLLKADGCAFEPYPDRL